MRETVYLAGGCFWGAQRYFDCLPGVLATEVGYANGRTADPRYEQVCHENTGHAETVKVTFDPAVLSLRELLEQYYRIIDPTSHNRQGGDVGTQYRTGIYTVSDAQLAAARASLAQLQKRYETPLAVEVRPLENFYTAEDYHQQYLEKNPGGYCHVPAAMFDAARRYEPKGE